MGQEQTPSLIMEASYRQILPNRMNAGPRCWDKFESEVVNREPVRSFHSPWLVWFVLTLALMLTSWANLSKEEDNSPGISCKFTCLMRGTDYSLLQNYLCKDICMINRLERQTLPLEENSGRITAHYKRFGSPSSRFLFSSETHFMCRYHLVHFAYLLNKFYSFHHLFQRDGTEIIKRPHCKC